MAREFIYHMRGLTKTYSSGKKVLDNVHLSFYPDAKIGVLASTAPASRRCCASWRHRQGLFRRRLRRRARGSATSPEPQLDPAKTVRENVMEGVAESQAILDRYNDLAMNYSERRRTR